jgi:hypothetical protein
MLIFLKKSKYLSLELTTDVAPWTSLKNKFKYVSSSLGVFADILIVSLPHEVNGQQANNDEQMSGR